MNLLRKADRANSVGYLSLQEKFFFNSSASWTLCENVACNISLCKILCDSLFNRRMNPIMIKDTFYNASESYFHAIIMWVSRAMWLQSDSSISKLRLPSFIWLLTFLYSWIDKIFSAFQDIRVKNKIVVKLVSLTFFSYFI